MFGRRSSTGKLPTSNGRGADAEPGAVLPIRVTASDDWQGQSHCRGPQQVLDDGEGIWNSGRHPPAWICLDFGAPFKLSGVELGVNQLPEGPTKHTVELSCDGVEWAPAAEVEGRTKTGDTLSVPLVPGLAPARYLRVTTTESPSWVAWQRIRPLFDERASPAPSPSSARASSAEPHPPGKPRLSGKSAAEAAEALRDAATEALRAVASRQDEMAAREELAQTQKEDAEKRLAAVTAERDALATEARRDKAEAEATRQRVVALTAEVESLRAALKKQTRTSKEQPAAAPAAAADAEAARAMEPAAAWQDVAAAARAAAAAAADCASIARSSAEGLTSGVAVASFVAGGMLAVAIVASAAAWSSRWYVQAAAFRAAGGSGGGGL